MTLKEQADAALAALRQIVGPEPALAVVFNRGQGILTYEWRQLGIGREELRQVLLTLLVDAITKPEGFHYTCAGCGTRGQNYGTPPLDGWVWTPAKALVCPTCRAQFAPAPVVQLVPRMDGVWGEDDALAGVHVSADGQLSYDEPDLGQAPTNLGTVPVPLFLDGDDDPEDTVVIDPAPAATLTLPAVAPAETEPHSSGVQVQSGAASEQTLAKAYQALGFVAPEAWTRRDAQVVRLYLAQQGEPVSVHLRSLLDRLDPQERTGG